MRPAGLVALTVACLMTLYCQPAAAGAPAEQGRSGEVEKPTPPPVENDEGYRPRWANPDAKPSQPGIENDPTPFDPSDVDANSDTLGNNLNNVDQ